MQQERKSRRDDPAQAALPVHPSGPGPYAADDAAWQRVRAWAGQKTAQAPLLTRLPSCLEEAEQRASGGARGALSPAQPRTGCRPQQLGLVSREPLFARDQCFSCRKKKRRKKKSAPALHCACLVCLARALSCAVHSTRNLSAPAILRYWSAHLACRAKCLQHLQAFGMTSQVRAPGA